MEAQQEFTVLDKTTLPKNTCRITKMGDSFVTCAYHLDKETGLKSGDLNLINIKDGKFEIEKTFEYDFGVLSLKLEKDDLLSMGCSDGSVKLFDRKDEKSMVEYKLEEDEDMVCLIHDTNEDKVASAMNTGKAYVFDKESK